MELMVVITIITLVLSIVLSFVTDTRTRARDAQRIHEVVQIQKALELFYDDFGRYPNATDGLNAGGEILGAGGTFDQLLEGSNSKSIMYMGNVPSDPRWDSGWGTNPSSYGDGNTYYYYGYDFDHPDCDPTLSIHLFESVGAMTSLVRNDATSGDDLDVDDSNYVYCPTKGIRYNSI